jgi:hypothetical protein
MDSSTHIVGHCGLCDGYRCLIEKDDTFGLVCSCCAAELKRIDAIMEIEPK